MSAQLSESDLRTIRAVELMYLANQRLGTCKTKTRAEVAGASKKLYKQKGTGRARAGNRRTPVRVGGGHAFAKAPRDWRQRLPAKMVRRSLQLVVANAVASGLLCTKQLPRLNKPSTAGLHGWVAEDGDLNKVLVVTAAYEKNLVLSARNSVHVKVVCRKDLCSHDLLHSRRIIVDSVIAGEFVKEAT